MRNTILTINTKDGYRADVYRKKKGKGYMQLFISAKDTSLIKVIREDVVIQLNEFYKRYIKSHEFNFRKDTTIGDIREYDPWMTIKKDDIKIVINEIIKIFSESN